MSLERPTALDFPPEAEGMDLVYCQTGYINRCSVSLLPGMRSQCCAQSVNGSC